ncbi:MAG: multiheme c-type cytochrome [Bacteroidota bacterium]
MIKRVSGLLTILIVVSASLAAQNKYIGTKMCAPCHRTEKQGKQMEIWQKSKHAEAYKALTTAEADKIAKSKGSDKPAAETAACLECHVTQADAKLVEKTFNKQDGVQCETCHGAGSAFKSIPVMKDHAKSVAAGMTEFKDEAAIEAKCKTCHNEKSPTFKGFKFGEYWSKIKHPVPKAG